MRASNYFQPLSSVIQYRVNLSYILLMSPHSSVWGVQGSSLHLTGCRLFLLTSQTLGMHFNINHYNTRKPQHNPRLRRKKITRERSLWERQWDQTQVFIGFHLSVSSLQKNALLASVLPVKLVFKTHLLQSLGWTCNEIFSWHPSPEAPVPLTGAQPLSLTKPTPQESPHHQTWCYWLQISRSHWLLGFHILFMWVFLLIN